MMSVNQTQAQIKLVEMWKSKNINNYPIKPDIITVTENGTTTRSAMAGLFRQNETPSPFLEMPPDSGIKQLQSLKAQRL